MPLLRNDTPVNRANADGSIAIIWLGRLFGIYPVGPVVVFKRAFSGGWQGVRGGFPMLHKIALLCAVSFSFALPALARDADTEQIATEDGSNVAVFTVKSNEEPGVASPLDVAVAWSGKANDSDGAFGGSASIEVHGLFSEQTGVRLSRHSPKALDQ